MRGTNELMAQVSERAVGLQTPCHNTPLHDIEIARRRPLLPSPAFAKTVEPSRNGRTKRRHKVKVVA